MSDRQFAVHYARVKVKFAASLFPFRFLGIQKDKAGWKVEEFTREAL